MVAFRREQNRKEKKRKEKNKIIIIFSFPDLHQCTKTLETTGKYLGKEKGRMEVNTSDHERINTDDADAKKIREIESGI